MTASLVDRIESWAREVLSRGVVRWQSADLHIDEVDSRYRDRGLWLRGGVECLRIAIEIRDRLMPSDVVGVVFHLKPMKIGGDRTSEFSAIEHDLTDTPPELVWLRSDQVLDYVGLLESDASLLHWSLPLQNLKVYDYQHLRPNGEISRTVWLVAGAERV